jgi:hypothetical protein
MRSTRTRITSRAKNGGPDENDEQPLVDRHQNRVLGGDDAGAPRRVVDQRHSAEHAARQHLLDGLAVHLDRDLLLRTTNISFAGSPSAGGRCRWPKLRDRNVRPVEELEVDLLLLRGTHRGRSPSPANAGSMPQRGTVL